MAARKSPRSRPTRALHRIVTPPRIVTLLWIATLLLPISAAAQPQPINITQRIGYDTVPTFARIQAAATSGMSTLVAWGAADEVAGATISRLYFHVRRPAVSGTTRLLVDTSFRPANALAVAPIDAGFIVVWDDRRADAAGMYTRRVSLDGSFAGAPTLLRASATALASIETFVTGAGTTLVWSDSLGELFVHRFGRDGATLIDRAALGRRAPGNARRLAGQPDLIEIPTASGVTIVDGSSGIRSVSPALIPRFSLPHTMLPDSSVAFLRDSTVEVYRSAFSDEVLDSLTVSIPRASLGLSSLGVSGDSVVVVSAILTHETRGMDYITMEFATWSWLRGAEPQRRVVLTYRVDQTTDRDGISIKSSTATRLCGNRTLVTVVTRHTTDLRPGVIEGFRTHRFLMWPSGAVTMELAPEPPVDDCHFDDTTRPVPPVARVTGMRSRSAVSVLGDTFSAPTRRFLRNVDELEPNVVLDRGRIIVTLRSAWKGSTIGFIPWTAIGADSVYDVPTFNRTPGRTSHEGYGRISGASTIERLESWSSNDPGAPNHGSHLLMAVGGSWPVLYETGDSWQGSRMDMALGVSADRREIVGFYPIAMRNPVVYSGPIEGPPRWKLEIQSSVNFTYAVHLDTARALLLYPRGTSSLFARIVGPAITTVDTFVVPGVDPILAALPVGSDRYVLISAQTSGGGLVVREMLVKGGAISTMLLPAFASLRDLFFLIDPSDSSVAILGASDVGIHMIRAGRTIVESPAWTTLTEGANLTKPSALFLGDTLYAAWSDTSTADADIYGIAMHRTELPQVVAPPAPEPGTFATSPVWPTPAQTRATLRIDVPEAGRLAVHLFDTRGLVVRTIERDIASPGWIDMTIDVSDLIDGIYERRASVGSRTTHARIAVVHDW